MIAVHNLIIGFFFSFIGSIPPGTINVSVIQLGLQKKIGAALRMGLAAALVEFVYATIAIKFQIFISSSPAIKENFQLISASVLILLGALNLISVARKKTRKQSPMALSIAESGFRKGVLLGIANPLAMPFWIGVTAYLQSNEWIDLIQVPIWTYVFGISLGTLAVLNLLAIVAIKTGKSIDPENKLIQIIPGLILLGLGLYTIADLYIL